MAKAAKYYSTSPGKTRRLKQAAILRQYAAINAKKKGKK